VFLCYAGILSLHNLENEIIRRNQNDLSKINNTDNRKVAKIDINHLIMSTKELEKSINLADKEKSLRL